MERTPKSKKSAYDVTQPVHPELDGTCFGTEYSPRTVQCQKCHDSTLCLIKYREVNDTKVKKVEAEHPMLDLERVPPVEEDWGQKLYNLAQKYSEDGNPMTREELGDALTRLERARPRLAQVVQLRYFAGLSEEEVGEVLDIDRSTVRRDWLKARGWLHERLGPDASR